MAKYDVKFSCGHTETIVLFGKMKDREKKIAWLEKTGLCKECYNRKENERNGKDHVEKKMLYKDYKNNFANCEVKRGSYNEEEKTIIVYVPVATGNEYDYEEPQKIKAYKGFKKDLSCEEISGKKIQYEKGKTYHVDDISESNYHAYENPIEVISGHYPALSSRYCEVELSGEFTQTEDDKWYNRTTATGIKIGKELSIDDIVKESIEYAIENMKEKEETTKCFCSVSNDKEHGGALALIEELDESNCSVAAATGENGISLAEADDSIAAATGPQSVAAAMNYRGIAANTGNKAVAYGKGSNSAAVVTTTHSIATAEGLNGIAAATNGVAVATATNECSAAVATMYKGIASVKDSTSVAVAWGYEAAAKGNIGSHILLADWRYIGKKEEKRYYNITMLRENWEFAGAKLIKIDGVKFKEDIYYRIVDGKVEEVK